MPNGKFRVAPLYGAGAAMGFTPQQVNKMSIWQFFAALNGYVEANTPSENRKMSTEEAEDLLDWAYEGLETAKELVGRVYFFDNAGFELVDEFTFTVH